MIKEILSKGCVHMEKSKDRNDCIKALMIREYKPGDLGYIDYMHCKLYEKEYGFDVSEFEPYVLPAMGKFLETKDRSGSMVWVAEDKGVIVGSIAIIQNSEKDAQLRWFIVDPSARGTGLGNAFMMTAIDFCRKKNYDSVFLWTVKTLDAARHLYGKYGFEITEYVSRFLWGIDLVEERWELTL